MNKSLHLQLESWFQKTNTDIDFYLETIEQFSSDQVYDSEQPLLKVRYYFRECFDHQCPLTFPKVHFYPMDLRHYYPDDLGISGLWYFYTAFLHRDTWEHSRLQKYVDKSFREYERLKSVKTLDEFLFENWEETSPKVKRVRDVEKKCSEETIKKVKKYILEKLYSKIKSFSKFNIIFNLQNPSSELLELCVWTGICLVDYYCLLQILSGTSHYKLIYAGYIHIQMYLDYFEKYETIDQKIHIGPEVNIHKNLVADGVDRCHILDNSFSKYI